MKTRHTKLVRLFFLLSLTTWAVTPPVAAQTPLSLSLRLNAGQAQLSVSGAVDSVCQIQWTENLSNTSRWLHLDHVVLSSSPSLLTDATSPSAFTRYYRAVWTPNTNLVWIPPGTFAMGSPSNEVGRFVNEGPQTAVTISQGFWMGKYLVTQENYQAVTGGNPSYFTAGRGYTDEPTRPVEQVSWAGATSYCDLLTQQDSAAGLIPTNYVYRLPTEAEWEHACRAGTTTRFSYGDDPGYANVTTYMWLSSNSGSATHPVGQKLPNPWGLYDMPGNVSEWCQDYFGGAYPGGSVVDPKGPATGSSPVYRGSSFGDTGRISRSAFRGFQVDGGGTGFIGFRIVLAPGQP